ncbi:glycosyltransferase family 4 protein [Ideonella sp. BN130291]|uniref:glycosyltransferase family 4 protein n=1 Tax=Ideonella sp. BN130291 TaxID=3112940 RepID=UPI002E26E8E8|nr:glycosyltransferase family 1 protein [Ideonella sp. BN130291]
MLVELRPALHGYAGIPQETRLLFRGLGRLAGIETVGLLQSSGQFLPPAIDKRPREPHEVIDRLSRVVIGLQAAPQAAPPMGRVGRVLARVRRLAPPALLLAACVLRAKHRLTRFDPERFKDFLWRGLFSKSLPSEDFDQITRADYRVCRWPYGAMHAAALATRSIGGPYYPGLDTRGFDVMLAMTPYPCNVSPGTTLVVRYFDAVPLLLPHTIVHTVHHQALHYHALRSNVASGAYFVCCSEATRKDLLATFPDLGDRAVTIPCMLSHDYFEESSEAASIADIVRKHRWLPAEASAPALGSEWAQGDPYLLMVSTLEPRKNHETLVQAWEQIKRRMPRLKLVLVGAIGWDSEGLVSRMWHWIARGDLCLLRGVPANEMRVLYRHAGVTVCPSYAEGFGYSGVEAMRCGGVVAASGIEVHREVCGDAAEYFDPYSATELANVVERLLDEAASQRRDEMRKAGAVTAARYLPDRIAPMWQAFFERLPR